MRLESCWMDPDVRVGTSGCLRSAGRGKRCKLASKGLLRSKRWRREISTCSLSSKRDTESECKKTRRHLLMGTSTTTMMWKPSETEASSIQSMDVQKHEEFDPVDGMQSLRDPNAQCGCATTSEERKALRLDGLIPPRVTEPYTEMERCLEALRRTQSSLSKYRILVSLQKENLCAFVLLLTEHADEMLPIIYTPTVGDACLFFGTLYPRPQGLYLSHRQKGKVHEILQNWPYQAQTVVMTDGERVLGLGDLGAHGMGVVCGKSLVYTAATGVSPNAVLPLALDVGTNNPALLADRFYLGEQDTRISDADHDAFVKEVLDALQVRFGRDVIIHLEDFAPRSAFRILKEHRHRCLLFDDDIQCTAAAVIAGLLGAFRLTGENIARSLTSIVFFGAGQANLGTASLLVDMFMEQGLSESSAISRIWMLDSQGLIFAGRAGVTKEKQRFQRLSLPPQLQSNPSLEEVLRFVRPRALIGASSIAGAFTPSLIRMMATYSSRPIIFSLSNPDSRSECTALAAYTHSSGRAIFASGSPSEPVSLGSKLYAPSQANNALIFPGLALGVRISHSRSVEGRMFRAAALSLASLLSEQDMRLGRVLPVDLQSCAQAVANAVARVSPDGHAAI